MKKIKKSRKKNIIIAASSALALLICLTVGALIWYNNSPFPTAIRLMSAIEEGDIEAALECIEPETAQKIRLIMSFTGISAESLRNMLLSRESGEDSVGGSLEDATIELSGYERHGDNACVSISVTSGEETTVQEINFVRISGSWYLSLE